MCQRTFLVIEDEPDLGRMVVMLAATLDVDVRLISENFTEIDDEAFMHVDGAIIDYMLPGCTGCTLARQAIKANPRLKIIMWTAVPNMVLLDPDCLGLPIVVKPSTLEELRDAISGR